MRACSRSGLAVVSALHHASPHAVAALPQRSSHKPRGRIPLQLLSGGRPPSVGTLRYWSGTSGVCAIWVWARKMQECAGAARACTHHASRGTTAPWEGARESLAAHGTGRALAIARGPAHTQGLRALLALRRAPLDSHKLEVLLLRQATWRDVLSRASDTTVCHHPHPRCARYDA